ncbi:hypothetical protein [Actinomadura rubrisoli]|uniref:Tetratricopeptide repeat protein n=1 Tax=Actinomadura rubrisoli TaxID=2530368 RepID=A0A4R5B5M4_9ACTN|nr:hypothetical protein [Actinomadura rubrisoli]TDD79910.1 hypothetical protein E1298_26825 [Actinomadura rubrisoli]
MTATTTWCTCLNALVHVRDWQEAEPVMAEVAGVAGEVGSARTTNLLGRIAGRVAHADAPSTIADLADALERLLGEGQSVEHDAGLG